MAKVLRMEHEHTSDNMGAHQEHSFEKVNEIIAQYKGQDPR